jgi:hypothetical protein
MADKMKQNKNDTLSKEFQNLIEKSYNGTKSISLTHLHIIWLDTGTSIKSGGLKQILILIFELEFLPINCELYFCQ